MQIHKKMPYDPEEHAFQIWKFRYARSLSRLDEELQPLFDLKLPAWRPNEKSFLKEIRKTLMISAKVLSEKLSMHPSTLLKFEMREQEGNISLANLNKIAEAMNCEVVLGIRPKNKKSFSRLTWQRLLEEAKNNSLFKTSGKNERLEQHAYGMALTADHHCTNRESMNKLSINRNKK